MLRLADLAASRYSGVSLEEIAGEFHVHERTAQRMVRALVQIFPHAVEVHDGADRKRRWRLKEMPVARMRLRGAEELEALEGGIAALEAQGDRREADALSSLRDRLLAALPPTAARAAEADADAMLEAHGVAARPGPFVQIDPGTADAVAQALKGPWLLRFSYSGKAREVEPYGILIGARRYLVAKQTDDGTVLRHFRLDRMTDVLPTRTPFARDPGFSLSEHAARAFGSYQAEEEYGEVVLRFSQQAADRAAEWRFHPTQSSRPLADGRLEVRFTASGWLEMAWHLLSWGDSVEVVSPEGLRRLLADPQRNGDVLP
ncbi:helix-turn-helix transcriptional regulator [Oceaniglobus roseus]|uniref:helix-turn-helix transcriptional regulator n=1 Tax=Oceaniglobus roseus TaxID=1737570 RepID=UPI001C12B3BC|nr:WYL domain-containing protein [Kandeliimicrobium roseum]